ncbi:hypothetical protein [Bdellovibrio sp. KM01]|uniref:hypothetical protein n=1 Tax=Bdellovibrio sp. KM01 TaxID=2748865 RepID=UPI0015EA587D|nr:hypothetical protein [Bdellovibrio sp. KM01]QLY23887.1 hypothetical protein HW988_10345 [Bdellovibrio sp. KM01]
MKNILMLLLLISPSAQAAFDQTNTRYLSGTEVVERLNLLFPAAVKYASANNNPMCAIGSIDQSAAGINTPATGRSIYLEPGTAFFNWYKKCSDTYVYFEFSTVTQETAKLHLGPLYSPLIDLNGNTNVFTPDQLMELITYTMARMLGPDEVILEYGYIKDCNLFRQELLNKVKYFSQLKDFLQTVERELISRDEFLSY